MDNQLIRKEGYKTKTISLLRKIGLTEIGTRLIVDNYFEKSCLEPEATKSRYCFNKSILNFLVECVLQLKTFETEIPLLIRYLTLKENKLNRFDYGRLLHLKAIKSWKIDNDNLFALHYLNKSISVLSGLTSKNSRGYLSRVYDTYGQLLTATGSLIDAREEFMRALEGRELVNDMHGKAITLGNLGRLSMQLGDFENAIKYLTEDLEIIDSSEENNLSIKAQLLSTISICYLELFNLNKAKEYNNLSRLINEKYCHEIGLIFNKLNDANIFLKENNLISTIELLDEIENDLEEVIIHNFIREYLKGKIFHLEARILYLQNKFDESNLSFEKALAIYNKELSVSPVETANLLYDYAQLAVEFGNDTVVGNLYRKSLRYLDATEESRKRALIEEKLKSSFKDSWILHSAGRFLGHEQINFLLDEAGKGHYAGEEKDVVVLFTDIRGFTTLSEKLKPKQLLALLNRFLANMTKAIEAYGGFVDKFMGDSIMAVFSLPNPNPSGINNDSEKAVLAALMMIEEIKRFNRNLPEGLAELKIGIGIHSGIVTAGLIGSPQKRSYTVIGDVSNTASRLEGMTKMLGAQVVVSKSVCDHFTRNDFITRPLGRFCPKGRENFVEVYDILGLDDGSPGLSKVKKECNMAGEALQHFYAREFEHAEKIYQHLILDDKTSERTNAYQILLKACANRKNNSPTGSWKGEIILDQK